MSSSNFVLWVCLSNMQCIVVQMIECPVSMLTCSGRSRMGGCWTPASNSSKLIQNKLQKPFLYRTPHLKPASSSNVGKNKVSQKHVAVYNSKNFTSDDWNQMSVFNNNFLDTSIHGLFDQKLSLSFWRNQRLKTQLPDIFIILEAFSGPKYDDGFPLFQNPSCQKKCPICQSDILKTAFAPKAHCSKYMHTPYTYFLPTHICKNMSMLCLWFALSLASFHTLTLTK